MKTGRIKISRRKQKVKRSVEYRLSVNPRIERVRETNPLSPRMMTFKRVLLREGIVRIGGRRRNCCLLVFDDLFLLQLGLSLTPSSTLFLSLSNFLSSRFLFLSQILRNILLTAMIQTYNSSIIYFNFLKNILFYII